MNATANAVHTAEVSKGALWAGRILTGLVVLFLIFDGVTKVIKEPHVMAASQQLGFTANAVVGIGAVLLICTAIYVIPRTSILGAILLTGYLGGAVAANVRAQTVPFNTLFPVIFGVLVWLGIFLRDKSLQSIIPFRR
jgi:hypothetical protein